MGNSQELLFDWCGGCRQLRQEASRGLGAGGGTGDSPHESPASCGTLFLAHGCGVTVLPLPTSLMASSTPWHGAREWYPGMKHAS
jgi:hypothetical protein